MQMPSVLFVCKANICRSPMAEALFKDIVKKQCHDADNWTILSAGTWYHTPYPAAKHSIEVMKDRGLDIRKHQSRNIAEMWLEDFDLILTMEKDQKDALQIEFPGIRRRIYMLSEMIDSKADIADPIGGVVEDFEDTAILLENTLIDGFPKILSLLKLKH